MLDEKRQYIMSDEAARVFRVFNSWEPASRIPLLMAKRHLMYRKQDIRRYERTLRALRSGCFF